MVEAQSVLQQLFYDGRSYSFWTDQPVAQKTLNQLYDALRHGPTANNACPARFVFLMSDSAKARLAKHMFGPNADKVRRAPVVVLVAYDEQFYEKLPALFRAYDAAAPLRDNKSLAEKVALRNSSLQGAYLMLAARALGLACGPMSGFDEAGVNGDFLQDKQWQINFICALGYGDSEKLYPKGPRLEQDEACVFL